VLRVFDTRLVLFTLFCIRPNYLLWPFAFGLMALAVFLDILVCLPQGHDVSKLEKRVEQGCSFFPSLGEDSGCTSNFLLQGNGNVVCYCRTFI
jgi:hypothetical protein